MSQTEDRPLAQPSLEEWQVGEIEEAIREADRGEFASFNEVRRTMERWTRRSHYVSGRGLKKEQGESRWWQLSSLARSSGCARCWKAGKNRLD